MVTKAHQIAVADKSFPYVINITMGNTCVYCCWVKQENILRSTAAVVVDLVVAAWWLQHCEGRKHFVGIKNNRSSSSYLKGGTKVSTKVP